MKYKITGLLLIVVALFFGYSILSCGTDYYLHLNLACPASWLAKSPPASLDNQIKPVESGTYVVYSVSKIYEPSRFVNELYSYRLEDKKFTKLFSEENIFPSQFAKWKWGNKILVGAQTYVDMNGSVEKIEDKTGDITWSSDGKIQAITETLDFGSGERGCTRDGLKINIFQPEGTKLVEDKIFTWKDYDLNQLCPETYYLSNGGKDFYVVGDSVGGGTVDTIMKYSVDEDKMTEINLPERDSWLASWQVDADNGWLGGVSLGYNLGTFQHVFRLNLISGEITDLVEPHSSLFIERVFLSADGNFWSPVFSDGAEGVQDCIRVLSVGRVLITDNEMQCLMSGKVIDWVEDILVVKRDEELALYNLTAKKIVVLDENIGESWDPDYQFVEYIGTIKID